MQRARFFYPLDYMHEALNQQSKAHEPVHEEEEAEENHPHFLIHDPAKTQQPEPEQPAKGSLLYKRFVGFSLAAKHHLLYHLQMPEPLPERKNNPKKDKKKQQFTNPYDWKFRSQSKLINREHDMHTEYAPETWKEQAIGAEIKEKLRNQRSKTARIANKYNKEMKQAADYGLSL